MTGLHYIHGLHGPTLRPVFCQAFFFSIVFAKSIALVKVSPLWIKRCDLKALRSL